MSMNYCPQCGHEVQGGERFCPSCGQALAAPAPHAAKAGGPRLRRIPPALLLLALAGLILIAAGVLWDGGGSDRGSEGIIAGPPTTTPAADIPFPDVPRVALAEAKEEFDGGEAIFVDVRERGDFETSHIPGALSIPLGESEMEGGYQELPSQAQIITYCT